MSYFKDRGCRDSAQRNRNSWAFAELQFVLDSADQFLDGSQVKRATHAANVYLYSYAFLAHAAIVDGKKLWKLRPKHHYFQHMMLRLALDHQNPCRQLQCGCEETFMGIIKRIGKACHGSSVYLRTMQRYLMYVSLRWHKRRSTGQWLVEG
jgi:hypothetical protein